LIQAKITETVQLLKYAIEDADLTRSDLDGIILVGGSSRIPLVSTMIEEKLKIQPVLINLPDEAVSHGATVQGAIIDKKDINTVLVDITPYSLGTGVIDNNTYFSDKILAWLKGKEEGEIPEEEEAPLDLGAQVHSATEFQKKYLIEVYQGEGKRLDENKIIGETTLEVAEPVEDGEVKVTFELDINGLLQVTAIETNTNEVVNATFQSSKGQKTQKSQVAQLEVINQPAAEIGLLKRATSLLGQNALDPEDQEELLELVNNYEAATGDTDRQAEIEEELLNLLYYLEKEGE